ncbi:MAG: hypothetical protein QOF78_1183 [Phycisphaerales bacterium]|jgi:hypothetical protein|nr:hypothetical protein [Phycisphaerales bacterium]
MLPASSSGGDLPAARPAGGVIPSNQPSRQLADLPKDELENLAEEYGLDPTDFRTRQHLVVAIHERRQAIAAMDRDAMLDVIKWGRRPVTVNATKEQIAQEIARIRSMKFAGLSHRGLIVLAHMRGLPAAGADPVPVLIRRLKRQEGLFAKLNRKRRAMLGSIVSNMIGDTSAAGDYQYLPPQPGATPTTSTSTAPPPPGPAGTIKDEIEESGLFGGIAGRIKKSADSYVNQKLDEIESRIDRKLDEIDRRLAEWRDKEIANRLRILKITLWASVIVGVMSLIYSYVKIYFAG